MLTLKSPEDYCIALGRRLRALRLQRNITQAELARQAGVSTPTLGTLERRGTGSLETLARVMYVLGREAELDELLALDPAATLDELQAPKRQRAR